MPHPIRYPTGQTFNWFAQFPLDTWESFGNLAQENMLASARENINPNALVWETNIGGHGWVGGIGVLADPTPPQPDPSPVAPPGTPPGGVHPSPLPGGNMAGNAQLMKASAPMVFSLIRAGMSSSRNFTGGAISFLAAGGILWKIAKFIGSIALVDWLVDQLGDNDTAESWAKFIEALDDLEKAGILRPWTAGDNPRTPGNEADAGPRFIIIDLQNASAYGTNFHMSRKGLRAHDDKQDTVKRPRTARRRKS